MAETKVYYHGATVSDASGSANPPPYTPTPPGIYPYPPGPYTQQPQFGGPQMLQATVMTGAIPVLITHQMGPNPTRITCKSCSYEIVTRVETKPTMRTHLFAAMLCLLGCWPCVCLPYCMDTCMNTDHYCPNCNAYVGSFLA